MERKSEPGNHSFSKVLTVNQGMSSFPNVNYWENGYKLSMTTTTTTLFFVSVERGPFAWTRVSCDWLMVYKGNHEPIITNSCPPKRSQKSLQRKLEPILSLVFLKRVGMVWSKQDNKTLWVGREQRFRKRSFRYGREGSSPFLRYELRVYAMDACCEERFYISWRNGNPKGS